MFNKRFKKVGKANKKIKNAVSTIYNGIEYKSGLEAFTARSLDEEGIKADYEKHTFVLQEKFEFKNDSLEEYTVKGKDVFGQARKNIQTIKYTPDFVDEKFRWIIETKGYKTSEFKLKWKMFKKYITDNGIVCELYMPKNQKQAKMVIDLIKNKYK